jgi:hypothetical protein
VSSYLRVHALSSLDEILVCSDKYSSLPLHLRLVFFFVDDFHLIPLYSVALIAGAEVFSLLNCEESHARMQVNDFILGNTVTFGEDITEQIWLLHS